MVTITQIPGYITLADAEERYGVKADTLKKRCQRGKVRGAIRQGKTWFVPNIPDVDPTKPISENYPTLNFDAATASNKSLYDAEDQARFFFYSNFNTYIYIWEHGFYFVSLFITHSQVDRTYLPLAALITEAQSALRASFLLNLQGYHSDAFMLLRKAHECIVKALACRHKPQKAGKLAFSTEIQSSESTLGVNFKTAYRLESSFTHANMLKLFEAWKDMQNTSDQVGVTYGPQLDKKLFGAAANTSLFWLYVLTRSLPYIFPRQFNIRWLDQQKQAEKLLKDYLTSVKAYSKEIISIDSFVNKIRALENKEEKTTE